MRALTVRQPAAWAIIYAGKDVENRTRSLGPYRGPVAIVAGREILDEDRAAQRAVARRTGHILKVVNARQNSLSSRHRKTHQCTASCRRSAA